MTDLGFLSFNFPSIEASLSDKKMVSDPNNLAFLISHLRELPEDARKYLIWASFFGATFKVTEVALMMDWEDSSGSSSDDDSGGSGSGSGSSGTAKGSADDIWNVPKAMNNMRDGATSRSSMRGLQTAIQEGWLVQRGREMCSFAHDRYRQASQSEAMAMSETTVQKMSFKVCCANFLRVSSLIQFGRRSFS